jgi:hypothetical protein
MDFKIMKQRKRIVAEEQINLAKLRILKQRKAAKLGMNKMIGAFDSDGNPLIHEMNYINNAEQQRKKPSGSQYPLTIKGRP